MQLTQRVHQYLNAALQPGDTALDATAGNGHDCLAMAQLIGPGGHLIGIDLQAAAIEATRERLSTLPSASSVALIQGDHAIELKALLPTRQGSIQAITFNLGYLPGSDKRIQTSSKTTLTALDCAQRLLRPTGILLVTAYRGHPGGLEEAATVAEWMRAAGEQGATIECHEPTAQRIPPILWVYRPV
jgi:ubiquinone/menaquinone biosynthesis C-methylase UbiE